MLPNAQPKPSKTRKQVKARQDRAESREAQRVRALCVIRDGDCILADPAYWLIFGACSGESEWCHLGERKRFKTRGMPPQQRHCTEWSFMGCTGHHRAYDFGVGAKRLYLEPESSHGADGVLYARMGGTTTPLRPRYPQSHS